MYIYVGGNYREILRVGECFILERRVVVLNTWVGFWGIHLGLGFSPLCSRQLCLLFFASRTV